MRKLTSTFALLALAATATAGQGWDWGDDFQGQGGMRHWDSYKLSWASDIHPNHPSVSWIENNVTPPTEEMWCHTTPAPTYDDCDEHFARMDSWLHAYLGIPPQNPLPSNLAPFPSECSSICYP